MVKSTMYFQKFLGMNCVADQFIDKKTLSNLIKTVQAVPKALTKYEQNFSEKDCIFGGHLFSFSDVRISLGL